MDSFDGSQSSQSLLFAAKLQTGTVDVVYDDKHSIIRSSKLLFDVLELFNGSGEGRRIFQNTGRDAVEYLFHSETGEVSVHHNYIFLIQFFSPEVVDQIAFGTQAVHQYVEPLTKAINTPN